jgi:N-acetylglutamate synthase-like GNAT family acetyltransferase
LSILPWHPDRARDFSDINREWVEAMFVLEDADRIVLDDPQGQIIDGGGDILFAEAEGMGIIGAGALKRTGDGAYELTKMGVRETMRGLKAEGFLLTALIARAEELGATKLYLLTNQICAAAIHLYEKAGFAHDAENLTDYGGGYQRCDVAMRYRGATRA